MALSGELSDLSLAELIEFFCNQRKTGRLKIGYERAPGFFYFQNGALADAKIGVLRGVDAVYFALTLENAQFKFSPSFPPEQRTINQPWAQVALEGLRRMDEGVAPIDAFPSGAVVFGDDGEPMRTDETEAIPEFSDEAPDADPVDAPVFGTTLPGRETAPPMSMMVASSKGGRRRKVAVMAAAASVLLIIGVIGVPAGWYGKRTARAAAAVNPAPASVSNAPAATDPNADPQPEASAPSKAIDVDLPVTDQPKANHEVRDRSKPEANTSADHEKRANAQDTAATTPKPEPVKTGPKMVTVLVSYDENGRVTQASGSDATATRVARQRRFPAGKPGTATVTIPLN